ncbi:MAG: diacylglycerol kinase [Methylococcales bacterium]|nr:diacylglycerol kinase [Methylococcales bacterium]
MANTKATGFKRIANALCFSMAGLKATWKNEEAFRQEVVVLAILTPMALWVTDNRIEQLLLIASIVLILIIELINSAIEAVVDRISSEHHELSGIAKDTGSAAVFIAMILAAVTWLSLLF